jgi:threonine aldolase
MIDFRSDTVTKPTDKMREMMSTAIVGDDVYEEDPTVNKLENRIAEMFGKESALFFPSGTMSNLTAIMTWCQSRGSEIILGDKSHIFLFEQSGAAQFGGVSFRTVPNLEDGTMDIRSIHSAIREDDIHEPMTKLICIENTHNVCGGRVLPINFMSKLREIKIPIHMDGARIWNAITFMKMDPKQIGQYADSMSVCLSKGLGAPIGSLLLGTREFILKARRIRKALGGGMRQVGVIAAAGLQSLDDFENGILENDHRLAKLIVNSLKHLKIFQFHKVETNILFINTTTEAKIICRLLRERGILVSEWGTFLIRLVVHRDITEENIFFLIKSILEVSEIINRENFSLF